jgi:lipopolysaccharide biosynthesis glycosyltransferase
MLHSLFENNKASDFDIYLAHSSLSSEELEDLKNYVEGYQQTIFPIKIEETDFENAPTLLHYTKEMYYRLLAYKYLPDTLDKILYLDPDILVINKIDSLYNMSLDDYLYAAAYHDKISVTELNKIRLYPYAIDAYYNSGVLLMNLPLQRLLIDEQEIYDFVDENQMRLIMPDQDILNALYSKRIKSIDEKLYNYDVRYYPYYKLMTNGACDMNFVMNKGVILHFCGKKKPWNKDYSGKFHALYKHYERAIFQDV